MHIWKRASDMDKKINKKKYLCSDVPSNICFDNKPSTISSSSVQILFFSV